MTSMANSHMLFVFITKICFCLFYIKLMIKKNKDSLKQNFNYYSTFFIRIDKESLN